MPASRPSQDRRSSRRRAWSALLLSVPLLLATTGTGGPAWAAATVYVSPTGDDSAAGTQAAPWRTLRKALAALRPGQTLLVRGGIYRERDAHTRLAPGTPSARIRVVAHPGERPVVQGLLWLKEPSYWDFRGIDVTWDRSGRSSEHMVKIAGGTGWTFTDAELQGARSYAAMLIAGNASGWTVARNAIHDTHPTNGLNQDHLIYASAGARDGVIERNLLFGSRNGRAVKVGPASSGGGSVSDVVIRYNTMVDNQGPSNVQLAWGTSRVEVYRNIMVRPAPGRPAVTAFGLSGSGNTVSQNLVWEAEGPLDSGLRGLRDGGGNLSLDPRFADPGRGDYRPRAAAAAGYGHLAGAATVAAPRAQAHPQPVPVTTGAPASRTDGSGGAAAAGQDTGGSASVDVGTGGSGSGSGTAAGGQDGTTSPIAFRASSTAAEDDSSRLSVARPAGTQPGDVLLSSVAVRGRPQITVPEGWRQLTSTGGGSLMQHLVYWRVAGARDPQSWSWGFSAPSGGTAIVVALGGVSRTAPVRATEVRVAQSSTVALTPALGNDGSGLGLAFAASSRRTSLEAGPGLVERAQVTSGADQRYALTSSVATFEADQQRSDPYSVTADHAGLTMGRALLLRPLEGDDQA